MDSACANNDSLAQPNRQAWLETLALAPADLIIDLMRSVQPPEFEWLRKPQTGLYMVRGRADGQGEMFNLGEITVSRCVVRAVALNSSAAVGVGYCLGRSHEHAKHCAIADLMLQDPAATAIVFERIIKPLQDYELRRQQALRSQAEATRVEFFTVARESNLSQAE